MHDLQDSINGDQMLHVNGLNIALDRKESGADLDFISHAHSDHVAGAKSAKAVFASTPTIELMNSIYGTDICDASIIENAELIDSGHMLGSKQLLINDETLGMSILYSGDFLLQESTAAPRIAMKNADVLIIDSTYPYPDITFDEREIVEAGLQEWTLNALDSGIVLFGAYAMGKAQELIKILNMIDIIPVVSKKISYINKIYEKHGYALKYASAYDPNSECESMLCNNFVGIVEKRNLESLANMLGCLYSKRVFTAVATGFAKIFRFGTDAQFALSDHADFSQSLEYIEQTGAKTILTYGPNAKVFAHNLKYASLNARPFSEPYLQASAEYKLAVTSSF